MGTIASRTGTGNKMGNTCGSSAASNVNENILGNSSSSSGSKLRIGKSDGSNMGVTVDHNDIRMRANSELSSQSSPNSSFCVKSSENVNCVKNGQVVYIVLLPHQHTFFCERKQRVCTAAGKIQEMEVLQVMGLEEPLTDSVWIRSNPGAPPNSEYSAIPGSENKVRYVFTKADVGCYISFRHAWMDSSISASPAIAATTEDAGDSGNASSNVRILQAENAIGPVLAGPARLLDLRVVGKGAVLNATVSGTAAMMNPTPEEVVVENGEFQVNYFVMAHINYIGGDQGCSEFWWLKTHPDGRREELTKRTPIADNAPDVSYLLNMNITEHPELINDPNIEDPRVYLLKPEDIGCRLKVKCCPKRKDGYAGEVCTSKPSGIIEGVGGITSSQSLASGESPGVGEESQIENTEKLEVQTTTDTVAETPSVTVNENMEVAR